MIGVTHMALHRENGKEQPFIPAGPFKIRIPFIHYRWEISECLQAILMCATCLGAIPVLQELLGVPYEVAWSMVIINGFFYKSPLFIRRIQLYRMDHTGNSPCNCIFNAHRAGT